MNKEDKIKKELLNEFSSWFCESYCMFYGNEDYCGKCPIKDPDCWLHKKPPEGKGVRVKEIHFCDYCAHFRPQADNEDRKPNNKLCALGKNIRFRCGKNDYNGEDTGFFFPGCEDFIKDNN